MIKPLNEHHHQQIMQIDYDSHDYPWTSEALLNSLISHQSFGFFESNQLIAFVFYRVIIDEAEVLHLVSHHQCTRQGIATRLLLGLINKLSEQQVLRLFLEVRETNIAAIGLYQKLGFERYALREHYYRNQENAVLMRLVLNQENEQR